MSKLQTTETVAGLIARIQSSDEAVSGAAWQNAGPYGAPAIEPLAALMGSTDTALALRARRALERVVRSAGHPALGRERRAAERELIAVLATGTAPARRTSIWMLSEIGGNRSVHPIAAYLVDPELREDARCALTRLPGTKAVSALKTAFTSAPEDFKFALAESLRVRGEKVDGYASRKMVPTAQTGVKAPKGKSD